MKIQKYILISVLICSVVNAYEYSGIDIVNVIEDFPGNHYNAIHTLLWEVYDGLDDGDYIIYDDFCFCLKPDYPTYFCEVASMYSMVGEAKCLQDYRPVDSIAPFAINLFLCGNIDGSLENHLWIDFYVCAPKYETFDDKTIILESDRLLYGKAVDVRKVIENGGLDDGIIQLIPITAGQYTIANPYGGMTLKIGTRLLSDINADGMVDLKDYNYVAEDFGEKGIGLAGDISGPDGIPDGYVNCYDLAAFAKEYLWE